MKKIYIFIGVLLGIIVGLLIIIAHQNTIISQKVSMIEINTRQISDTLDQYSFKIKQY